MKNKGVKKPVNKKKVIREYLWKKKNFKWMLKDELHMPGRSRK